MRMPDGIALLPGHLDVLVIHAPRRAATRIRATRGGIQPMDVGRKGSVMESVSASNSHQCSRGRHPRPTTFLNEVIAADNDGHSRHLDPQRLRTLVCTARLGNVNAAAVALNLTQGTVSQRLKRLEQQVGRRRLERDYRGAPSRAARHPAPLHLLRGPRGDSASERLAAVLRRP